MVGVDSTTEPHWAKVVLIGLPGPALREGLSEATGHTKYVGRLIMDGDSVEFAIGAPAPAARILIAKIATPPFHETETLSIVLGQSSLILFANGLDRPWRDYGAVVEAHAAGTPIEVVNWHCDMSDAARHVPYVDATLAAVRRVAGRSEWRAVNKQCVDAPLLPREFPPCYEGNVWGWGVGGEQLRDDVRLPPNWDGVPIFV